MSEAFVVTSVTRSAPLNVVREQITVLAPGSRTGGYEIFRQALANNITPTALCGIACIDTIKSERAQYWECMD
jgi:hypothetical protein